jgi:Glycosyl hydrolase catalytic core
VSLIAQSLERLRELCGPGGLLILDSACGHPKTLLARLVNAIAVHPYPAPLSLGPYYRGPDVKESFARVALIRQAELAAGLRLPIWITEIGWSTAPDTPQAVPERIQATYLLDAIRRSLGQWSSYVSKIFLFGWFRSSSRRGDLAGNYGLLHRNGVPKRAWIEIAHLLGGKPGGRDPDVPAAT